MNHGIPFPAGFKEKYPHAKDLIEQLLVWKPDLRLGYSDNGMSIRNHAFFAETNWQQLLRKQIQAPFVPVLESPIDTSYFDGDSDLEHEEPRTSMSNVVFFDGF